jgi:dihydroflavonol-4-reductase
VDELDRPDEFDETVWSDLETPNFQHVHKSKLLAEKAAFDFVKEGAPFSLVSLVPTLLVGPSLVPRVNTSSAFLTRMLRNQLQGMYRIQWGLVDVRDAALAHVRALSCVGNQRIIVSARSMWCKEIGLCLADRFGD